MDKELAQYIRDLEGQGRLYRFYKSRAWKTLRQQVLEENHFECARCASVGRYTKATMVHHVNEVKRRPDLALSRYFTDERGEVKPNLLPLCDACHEREHKRFAIGGATDFFHQTRACAFKNEERW